MKCKKFKLYEENIKYYNYPIIRIYIVRIQSCSDLVLSQEANQIIVVLLYLHYYPIISICSLLPDRQQVVNQLPCNYGVHITYSETYVLFRSTGWAAPCSRACWWETDWRPCWPTRSAAPSPSLRCSVWSLCPSPQD